MANRFVEDRAPLGGLVQGAVVGVSRRSRPQVAAACFHRRARQRTYGRADARYFTTIFFILLMLYSNLYNTWCRGYFFICLYL